MAYHFSAPGSSKTSFGSSGSSTGFHFSSPKRKTGGLTLNQLLTLQAIEAQNKDGSLLGSILRGGKSALGFALRQISRPNWGMAEGTRRALEGDGIDVGDFFKGFSRGFQAKKHTYFSDVLAQEGLLKGHGRLRGAAGFGLDVVTDPTIPLLIASTFVTGGATAPVLAGRLAVAAGVRAGAEAAVKEGAARIAASKLAKDSFDEAFAHFDEAGDLARSNRARAIQEQRKARAMDDTSKTVWTEHDETLLNMAQKDAELEIEQHGTKVLQPAYSIPFTGGRKVPLLPTRIGGQRVLPRAPSVQRVGEGGGILGKIPGAAQTAQRFGTIFKHGFDNPQFAKAALMAQKEGERLMDTYSREAQSRFGPLRDLTEDERLAALKFGEETPNLILRSRGRLDPRRLDDRKVELSGLSKPQQEFLQHWHTYWEHMRLRDQKAGIDYKPLDKVYVPHVYTHQGGLVTKTQLQSQVGYSLDRAEHRSVDELKKLVARGDAKTKLNLETDILALAATRTRRAAQAHAKKALAEHMRTVHGVKMWIPDPVAKRGLKMKMREINQKRFGLDTHNPLKLRAMRAAATRRANRAFEGAVEKDYVKAQAHLDDLNDRMAGTVAGIVDPGARTPSFSNLLRIGSEKFEQQIAHFSKADKAAAREARGLANELTKLRTQIKKMEKEGAHGSKFKALAGDVARLVARTQKKGLSAEQVEALGKDTSKGNIGYVAQPQGKTRIAKSTGQRVPGEEFRPTARGESWKGNLDAALTSAEANVRTMWQAVAKKYPNTRGASERTLKQQRAQFDKVSRDFQKKVVKHREARDMAKAKSELDLADRFDAEAKKLASYERQLSVYGRRYDTVRRRNPNIPENYVKYEGRIGGEHYAFSPDMHHAMSRIERVLDDEEIFGNLESSMRKALSYWKIGVTSINPGYRIRNTISDLWNMYIAGVPMARIVQYSARAASMQRRVNEVAKKLADAAAEGKRVKLTKTEKRDLMEMTSAYNHGVLSGLFQGDIQTVAAMYRTGTMTKAFMEKRRPDIVVARWAQSFNRHGENWGRLTHYLYRREYEKLGANEAANWVKKAHFDYEELTPAEQQKFKKWLPFYTWTRKNIPYQLTQLAARPGKYATFPKGVAESNAMATGDAEIPGAQEQLMPGWMKEQYAFHVPFGGDNAYMIPQFGVSDLSKLEHPSNFLQLLGPQLKLPIELGTRKSLLTGQPITGGVHPRNPISDWSASVLEHVPGANVGPTSRSVRGEKVSGAGGSPWITYIAGQLPMANYAVNRMSTIKRAQQGGTQIGSLPVGFGSLSYIGGVSTYDRDLETEMAVSQIQWQDQMKKVMRGLRDSGLLSEAKTKKQSKYQLSLEQLLAGG